VQLPTVVSRPKIRLSKWSSMNFDHFLEGDAGSEEKEKRII